MHKVVLIFTMALLAMPAAVQAQDEYYGDSDAPKVTDKWEAAYNAGDGAAIAALYSKDAVLYPPNSAPVSGADAIEAFWTQGASQGASTELTTKDFYSMGDMAVEVGTYSGTNADGSHDDHGHFTVIYKKVDGKWMMFRDMWNSDMSQ